MLNSIPPIPNPTITTNPPIPPTPHPESYTSMLKESVDHFLAEYRRGSSDFSTFRSIFFRLFQTMPDPPLEIIWFYSAITYHSSKSALKDNSNELLVAKDMFQLLVSCSSPCNGFRKVAVLVPVVYELFNRLCDFPRNLSLRREIEGLVEGIISYISICCGNYDKECGNLLDNHMACFSDLIRVWTVDRGGDNLEIFFPLVSEEICRGIGESGVGYLAGVVMIEVFLLSLCLKFGARVPTDELEKGIRDWAVQIIKGFHNCYFLDMLLRVLLEPHLPVTTLLKSEDEVLLRKVLYDAVLLEEYSFLNSGSLAQLLGCNDLKNLSLVWLLVADNAMQFVRENGDHIRATSYADAFSVSHLPNQLMKWVTSQNSMEETLSRPKISTPKALIKWLLVLDDQGIRIFNDNVFKFHAKAAISKLTVEYELPEFKPNNENQNADSFFHIGNEANRDNEVNGDQEMVDSLDHEFSVEVSPATNGRRKREEGFVNEGLPRIKLVKYNID
ncbi:hypothetical protein LguiA_017997 [Lonicera macranthoides]